MSTPQQSQCSEIFYHLLDLQYYSTQSAREEAVLVKYTILPDKFHENKNTSLSTHRTPILRQPTPKILCQVNYC